jgi:hypothetical protein
MTSAPWSTAQVTPSATDAVVNLSPSAPTEIGMIIAPGATPSAPPSTARPAISVAIAVPWPSLSSVPSVPLAEPNPAPGSSAPARSGRVSSTPESTTATTTPSPRVVACAADTPKAARCHCCSSIVCARATPGTTIAIKIAAATALPVTNSPCVRDHRYSKSIMFHTSRFGQAE